MESSNKNIAIILINWNNASDTIECLESIQLSRHEKFTVFVVDNHSNDDSVIRILGWLKNQNSSYFYLENVNDRLEKELFSQSSVIIELTRFLLIKNGTNLGFAKGNNLVLNFILNNELKYDYCYLLNNDTVIAPDTLSNLLDQMENKSIKIANSIIYDYYNRELIQFAGGLIYPWGKARFFYKKKNGYGIKSEFTHGCALMVDTSIFKEFGILTERFFHGEEDFEFSMRMKKNRIQVWCFFDSIVYHKEGATVKKYTKNREQKLILSGLNRIIDMKNQYPIWIWHLWKFLTLFYYSLLLRKKTDIKIKRLTKLILIMNKTVDKIVEVNQNTVPEIIERLDES